jgi:predicted nuclease with TOPRIM domain|tara:strand:+ start:340 stop:624 length:285 start_codon:yes stop_codon:yes gene_type:complete
MPHINELNVEETFKKQIAEDNKEKYNVYNRVIELSTENEQLKHKIKQFKESNSAMADELKSNFDVVRDKLKRHQWSFDNDPNGELKKAVLELIA